MVSQFPAKESNLSNGCIGSSPVPSAISTRESFMKQYADFSQREAEIAYIRYLRNNGISIRVKEDG